MPIVNLGIGATFGQQSTTNWTSIAIKPFLVKNVPPIQCQCQEGQTFGQQSTSDTKLLELQQFGKY